jgi:hypothetical protein
LPECEGQRYLLLTMPACLLPSQKVPDLPSHTQPGCPDLTCDGSTCCEFSFCKAPWQWSTGSGASQAHITACRPPSCLRDAMRPGWSTMCLCCCKGCLGTQRRTSNLFSTPSPSSIGASQLPSRGGGSLVVLLPRNRLWRTIRLCTPRWCVHRRATVVLGHIPACVLAASQLKAP